MVRTKSISPPLLLKEISIGCRKKEGAGLPPDNDLCFVKFQSMILSPVADQLPLLPSSPASLLVHNF